MSNELMNLIDTVEIDSISSSLNKVASVQTVIQKTLKQGHDFDTIPGTGKPTLLKPGAEKILMMFGLTSEYEIIDSIEDWKQGVFSYTVRCILSKGGTKITEGLGSCNSKEDKYRYRWVKPEDVPMGVDPDTLKSNQYGKVRIDNDEIYSLVNTILKMAKKRAQVDATLTVASLSEVFTQDIEDMKEFSRKETMENMSIEDAKRIKVTFGKYKGELLGDLIGKDKGYIKWLSANATTPQLKQGASILLSEKFIGNDDNKSKDNNINKNNNQNKDNNNDDGFFPPINEDDIPFI